jgi:hypothetical protein
MNFFRIYWNFSSFDELLTPFSPMYSTARASFPGHKRLRAHSRQSSCDSPPMRTHSTKVKNTNFK